MNLNLTGRVAVITGASKGLGKAIAKSLAEEGCQLALVARQREPLEQLAEELPPSANVLIITHDITKEGAADTIHHAVISRFGRCDILVNNAGASSSQKDQLGDDDIWTHAMLLNFEAGRRIAHRFIPAMRTQQFGRVLSITGQDEPRDINPANAPNGAVHIWSKAISRIVGRDGVTINCIAPGRIHSEQIDSRILSTAEALRNAEQEIPVGYVGEPQDLAVLATFLCSPIARYITGQVIHVDGGVRRFSH